MIPQYKILHVVNISFVLPYFIGDQFDHFSQKGIEFHVACTPSAHFSNYSIEKNFKPIGVNILREVNIKEDIKSIFILYKYIKKNNIDVVIGHTPKGGLIAMIAAYMAGVQKRTYFRHGIMFETSKGLKRFVFKNIERFTGFLAKQVICVSRSVVKVSDNENLNSPSKNTLLNRGTCNGVNIERFSILNNNHIPFNLPAETTCVIGYVGRLVKDKGIIELIGAWKKILLNYTKVKLLLVGPLEDRDRLPDEIIAFIKQEPSIIYTDLIDNTIPYYQAMNIFILPSLREGFPTVVLEASAMELPVITTKSTGCIDSILENITGLFTEINEDDMFEKMKFYIDNPSIREQHGKAGRQFIINNFDQRIIWNEIENKILNNE